MTPRSCRIPVLATFVVLLAGGATAQSPGDASVGSIDPVAAQRIFEEMEAVCGQDDGRLWGISLCGPTLFVDRATRDAVANRAGLEGTWKRSGEVFLTRFPRELPAANTTVDWAGLQWTEVLWPLPGEKSRRAELLMHESWHRIQHSLGLPQTAPSNAHLDQLEGRYWLLLEMRALATALTREGPEKRRATADAIAFREHRQSIFPNATEEERALENHEGLAAYTGSRLGLPEGAEDSLARVLVDAVEKDSLVRSFAYATGPAYGLLLDEVDSGWRKRMRSDVGMEALLQAALVLELPTGDLTEEAERYRGVELREEEERRAARRSEKLDELRRKLVDGRVLRLPNVEGKFQFDPTNLLPLPGQGTVYPSLRLAAKWGVLEVEGGAALMSEDWSEVVVPVPPGAESAPLEGEGWQLELAPGWRLATGDRPGDFEVRREEP